MGRGKTEEDWGARRRKWGAEVGVLDLYLVVRLEGKWWGGRMVLSASFFAGLKEMGYIKTARSKRIAKRPITFKQHIPFLDR